MDTDAQITPMTEEQANEVLRKTAEHAVNFSAYLYGQHHLKASELISEALIVNKASRDARAEKTPPS